MRARHLLSAAFVAAVGVIVATPLTATDAIAGPANGLEDEVDAGASADAAPPGPCPPDMLEIRGDYCPEVVQRCLRPIPSPSGAERCSLFAPTARCKHPTVKKHYCIDKFEYPNKAGDKPAVMKTWTDGQEVCRSLGKRLCGDSEWTLACEGSRRLPYPYGLKRDAKACNIDRPHPPVDERALADPKRAAAEAARLWQGEPSGARSTCVSPYGVFDMTGNVDEWVVNESGKPYKSGLKGGYWGPVRARCRPMTTTHGEAFPFYQTGFRCCADSK
jgi:sulfatase modifying factor 1